MMEKKVGTTADLITGKKKTNQVLYGNLMLNYNLKGQKHMKIYYFCYVAPESHVLNGSLHCVDPT